MLQVEEKQKPKVGVGLLLIKGNQVLLGKRKGAHGSGEYGGPGGHLELMESFEGGLRREIEEEAGSKLKIKNLRFLCVTNLRKYAPKHYIDIGMVADWEAGEPQVMEPDKLENWKWYDIGNLPAPLFAVEPNYVKAYKTGQTYFTE
jgi:8-oxo-dGTP diphosphatase